MQAIGFFLGFFLVVSCFIPWESHPELIRVGDFFGIHTYSFESGLVNPLFGAIVFLIFVLFTKKHLVLRIITLCASVWILFESSFYILNYITLPKEALEKSDIGLWIFFVFSFLSAVLSVIITIKKGVWEIKLSVPDKAE